MTNTTIILNESFRLMKAGILSGSGRFVLLDGENGPEKVELPEDIHTFAAWKARGYIVKKGEHAIACFPVWKYSGRRNDSEEGDTDGETENSGRCYLRKAFFFKMSQVKKITA